MPLSPHPPPYPHPTPLATCHLPQLCPDLPIILYISGSGALLERMAACNPDIISLCNTVDMTEGIARCGTNFAYQVRLGQGGPGALGRASAAGL
jgi:hypothetical protein